jgi:hypothetical protein
MAQSTATLQGTITDSKGAVLPNATVTVRNRIIQNSFDIYVQDSFKLSLRHTKAATQACRVAACYLFVWEKPKMISHAKAQRRKGRPPAAEGVFLCAFA